MPEKSGLPLARRGILPPSAARAEARQGGGDHRDRRHAALMLAGRIEFGPQDSADISGADRCRRSHRRGVAEVVDAGGVLVSNTFLATTLSSVRRLAEVADDAEPGVGQVVGLLPAVGRLEQLLEVVLGAVGVVGEGVDPDAEAEDLVLVVEAHHQRPFGRADDLLAGVVADRDRGRERPRAGGRRPVGVGRVVVGAAEVDRAGRRTGRHDSVELDAARLDARDVAERAS